MEGARVECVAVTIAVEELTIAVVAVDAIAVEVKTGTKTA